MECKDGSAPSARGVEVPLDPVEESLLFSPFESLCELSEVCRFCSGRSRTAAKLFDVEFDVAIVVYYDGKERVTHNNSTQI